MLNSAIKFLLPVAKFSKINMRFNFNDTKGSSTQVPIATTRRSKQFCGHKSHPIKAHERRWQAI